MQVNSPILNFSTKKTKLMKELTEVAWFIDSVGAKGQLFMAVDAKASGLLLCHVSFRKVKTPVQDSAKVSDHHCRPPVSFRAARLLLIIDESV